MSRLLIDTLKLFMLFMISACIFYYVLQLLHNEYQEIHRYDPPQGPAVKVLHSDDGQFNWLPFDIWGGK